jgi:hypothetical protein
MGQAALKLVEKEDPVISPISIDKSVMKEEAEKKRLKEFGVLMAAVFTGIAALMLYRGRAVSFDLLLLATIFMLPAYLSPLSLRPIEKVWMAFGEKMSMVMTTVLLVLTYYLVMTPIGLFLRVIGKDLLDQKLEPEAKSYWKKIEANGPTTRPYLPY